MDIKHGPITNEALLDALRHHSAEDIDVFRMAQELQARRAADLTSEEREALAQLRRDVEMQGCSNLSCPSCEHHALACEVLDRLLATRTP